MPLMGTLAEQYPEFESHASAALDGDNLHAQDGAVGECAFDQCG